MEISIFNSILTRIMKENNIYNGYKHFIIPNELDQLLQSNVNTKKYERTTIMFNSFMSILYTASKKHRNKYQDKIHKQHYISELEFNRFQNFTKILQGWNNLNGLIIKSLQPWCLSYITKLLGNSLDNFEKYISIKHNNKINTLEEYINHCIKKNRNIFNLINGVILFLHTNEGFNFWNEKNIIFTNELLKILLSKGNIKHLQNNLKWNIC